MFVYLLDHASIDFSPHGEPCERASRFAWSGQESVSNTKQRAPLNAHAEETCCAREEIFLR
jgi:hypothetical protein